MKLGSKILLGVTLFLIVLSVSATFYKTVILQDFEIVTTKEESTREDNLEEVSVLESEPAEDKPSEPLSIEGENVVKPELDI